ncbi:PREDICTED: uncharacterized protein LOC108796175 [Nanorana parkeri]|uniref:uncharacterized protein LOC108796175 n=1 Tax=Nanorana parkeri TaxID=125878 RepID=UPI0008549022|nr:PREDICTED: uncharacterized protein LOC108796175 [Nanorana parkeri]
MRTGEGTCEEGTSLEASLPEESVIIISDDEGEVSALGNSVLLIEEAAEESFAQEKRKLEVLDDELAITYSKKGHVLPHARYDCTLHPFMRVENETEVPMEQNASFCSECYCYLCDKPASECSSWTCTSSCHCNAHNKSKYWKELRDTALAGVLTMFQLDLTEIDTELREGGNQLQHFLSELSQVQQKYREGAIMTRESTAKCFCACHRDKRKSSCYSCTMAHVPVPVHNYMPVYQLVTEYLNRAENQHPKTAAVMLLGAAREILLERILTNPFPLPDTNSNVKEATASLMSRIVSTLQRHLVLADYPRNLYEKFIMFFQSIPLPPHCYNFVNSMNVIRWDNCFLTSVLAGQNLAGTRTLKGKRENLCEALPVVQSRVQRLEGDLCYRQLVRYLRAVKCPDPTGLDYLKQKIAFYSCKFGDFPGAAIFLLQTKGMLCPLAKRLTPAQFELYLTMLHTKSCLPGNELVAGEVWIPCKGPPLKTGALLRTAIRILHCNTALLREPKCWSTLVRIWSTCDSVSEDGQLIPRTIPEPDKSYQLMVMDMSCSILDELQRQFNAFLPPPFHKPNGVAAELIVIVQAIVRFMMTAALPLPPMLELVFAFGFNIWALALLFQTMIPMRDLLLAFITSIDKELHDNEQQVLNTLDARGASYVSNLISVFLPHGLEPVRLFGLHMIDILLKNTANYTWISNVGNNLKNIVCNVEPQSFIFNNMQKQQLLSKLEGLTAENGFASPPSRLNEGISLTDGLNNFEVKYDTTWLSLMAEQEILVEISSMM